MAQVVQFVSKPVDPPINDGTKHIVLTLAGHMTRYKPCVMTTRDAGGLPSGVAANAIYASASSYAPSLLNNLRAARHVALERHAALFHYVFAPNARSSQMGRLLSLVRRSKVVQTIASRPRSFSEPAKLLFGSIVVAQSHDTRNQFIAALREARVPERQQPRIDVIGPPLGEVRVPTPSEADAVRASLGVDATVPLLLYPGDLEVGGGASRVAAAAAAIAANHPTAVLVFAYRDKTTKAVTLAQELSVNLSKVVPPERFRFVRESKDILALVRESAAVLFPVDDLYGKVDLPIILLEAMSLGTPIVVGNEGPLSELDGSIQVALNDTSALTNAALSLLENNEHRQRVVAEQRRTVATRFSASSVTAAYELLYDELLGRNA